MLAGSVDVLSHHPNHSGALGSLEKEVSGRGVAEIQGQNGSAWQPNGLHWL